MKTQIALSLAATLATQASIVSWNYDRFGTVTGDDTAGVVPAANWNNSWPANPTTDLIDKDGQPTTLDIAYTSFNTWSIQESDTGLDSDGTSNKRLLNGYLNAGPAEWGPAITASSVTISQIPYPDYDIIVYFSSDGADREGTVSDGATTYHFKTLGVASIGGDNATFVQATDATPDGYDTGANYAIFSGLSGAVQTITVQMRDDGEWGGIAGFQIVADLGSVPEFGLHPEDQSVAVGSTATFTAAAAADPAPDYQWEYSPDGLGGWTPLEGETSTTLIIVGVLPDEEGYYRLVATNPNGSVPSEIAFLETYYASPEILTQPKDAYAVEGSTVQLTVWATGYEMLTYQWYKDDIPMDGETSDTLVLPGVDATDAGVYFVEITDSAQEGLVTVSDHATVFVFPEWDGLVSHDSFDPAAGYETGELPLQDPPVDGYDGAWTDIDFGDAEPEIIAGSLTYPDPLYLGSSGHHAGKAADTESINATNSGRTYRKLAPRLVVADNTTGTRYLSWLYRNGNEDAVPQPYIHSVLSLYQDTGGAAPSGDAARRTFQAGISEADFATTHFGFRYDDWQVGDLGVAVDANVHLFVVKFELSDEPGGDSITVWLDPPLGTGEPAGGITFTDLEVAFDSLALSDYASNSVAWDEIRWGSTFDSVTLHPDPPEGFAAWIAGYPGVGELDDFDDDADGDGLANGVEYYFGTDPSAPNADIGQVVKSGNTVTMRHPRNIAPVSGLTAVWQWSTDLLTWHDSGSPSDGSTVTFTASPDTPSSGVTTVTATIAGTIPAKLFTRLRLVPAP